MKQHFLGVYANPFCNPLDCCSTQFKATCFWELDASVYGVRAFFPPGLKFERSPNQKTPAQPMTRSIITERNGYHRRNSLGLPSHYSNQRRGGGGDGDRIGGTFEPFISWGWEYVPLFVFQVQNSTAIPLNDCPPPPRVGRTSLWLNLFKYGQVGKCLLRVKSLQIWPSG